MIKNLLGSYRKGINLVSASCDFLDPVFYILAKTLDCSHCYYCNNCYFAWLAEPIPPHLKTKA